MDGDARGTGGESATSEVHTERVYKPAAEFGERSVCCVHHDVSRKGQARRSMERRSVIGSGESLTGTREGVVKARDFRRKAEHGGRWSVAEFEKFV